METGRHARLEELRNEVSRFLLEKGYPNLGYFVEKDG
jgi:hypothetical protein